MCEIYKIYFAFFVIFLPLPSGATREPLLSYPPAFRKSKCQKIRFFDSVLYNPPFVGTIQRVRKQKGLTRAA